MKDNVVYYIVNGSRDYAENFVATKDKGIIQQGDTGHEAYLVEYAYGYADSINYLLQYVMIDDEYDLEQWLDVLVELDIADVFQKRF